MSINEQDRICSLLFPVQYVCNNTLWIDFICLKYGTVPVTALVTVVMNLRFARLEVPTAVEDSEVLGCDAV